ncbi:hypothetical protein BTH41_02508 [Bacillus mycoides]|nr:hypothetical protein BTH41_02508 [Bacillus mycoides]
MLLYVAFYSLPYALYYFKVWLEVYMQMLLGTKKNIPLSILLFFSF